jgi:hypothetical protein
MPDTLNIRIDALRGSYYDEDGMATYKKVMDMRHSKTQTQIAKELDKHVAVINRMCKDGYTPHATGARYLSNFFRDTEWFLTI